LLRFEFRRQNTRQTVARNLFQFHATGSAISGAQTWFTSQIASVATQLALQLATTLRGALILP
jgi:hypothetical protein